MNGTIGNPTKRKKLIIFGCGQYGIEALHRFGKEYVAFFCDNDPKLNGQYVQDVKVISFNKLRKSFKDYIILLAIRTPGYWEVKWQLDYFCIPFIPYTMIRNNETFMSLLITDYFFYGQKICSLINQQEYDTGKVIQNMEKSRWGIVSTAIDKTKRKIEFYLIDAFEVSHFENLYKILMEMGYDVSIIAEKPEYNVVGDYFNYDDAIHELEKRDIPYYSVCNPCADYALTTQYARCLAKYSKKTKKINIPYGTSFFNAGFGGTYESMRGFDIKLIHGQYDEERWQRIMPDLETCIVGYPRYWDRSFFGTVADLRSSLKITTNKPIICYLPTWDEHSSISLCYQRLKNLKNKFYIVTRPHHCTWRLQNKKKDLDMLYELSDLVLPPDYSFMKFAHIGDIMISDIKSGATLEGIFLNSNIPTIWLAIHEDLEAEYNPLAKKISCILKDPNMLTDQYILQLIKNDPFKKYRMENIGYYFQKISKKILTQQLERIFI